MITSSDAARMVYEAVSNLLWYHSNRLAGLRSRVSGNTVISEYMGHAVRGLSRNTERPLTACPIYSEITV